MSIVSFKLTPEEEEKIQKCIKAGLGRNNTQYVRHAFGNQLRADLNQIQEEKIS